MCLWAFQECAYRLKHSILGVGWPSFMLMSTGHTVNELLSLSLILRTVQSQPSPLSQRVTQFFSSHTYLSSLYTVLFLCPSLGGLCSWLCPWPSLPPCPGHCLGSLTHSRGFSSVINPRHASLSQVCHPSCSHVCLLCIPTSHTAQHSDSIPPNQTNCLFLKSVIFPIFPVGGKPHSQYTGKPNT